MNDELNQMAMRLSQRLRDRGLCMASAESCTGGWIAKAMTDIPGSSACFERGFITYSNAAKQEMLGVDPVTLERHGAVSEEVVRQMVHGAIAGSQASVAVAVSGIAGPDGGSDDKPVGTVWFAWGRRGRDVAVRCELFSGDRAEVRYRSSIVALQGLFALID